MCGGVSGSSLRSTDGCGTRLRSPEYCGARSPVWCKYTNEPYDIVYQIILRIIHLGIAIDTDDGLFVPVLRDVKRKDATSLRRELDALKARVRTRKIPPEELRGNTFTLSNFGTFAGRYADPIVVPPTVAILGAGKVRAEVVAAEGAPAVHRVIPLSLTFDHRSVTGGEAGRFLGRVIEDLERAD